VYVPTRHVRNILIKRYILVADVASFNNLYLQGACSILEVSVVYPRYLVMLSRTHRDNTFSLSRAQAHLPTLTETVVRVGVNNACISFRGLQCRSYSPHAPRHFPNGQLAIRTLSISSSVTVGTATGYGLEGRGSIPGNGTRFLSTPQCTERL
jgi:hypothetical protein